MKTVHTICVEQRRRHSQMAAKRTVLRGVLKRIQKTSENAIQSLKDLQNMHEDCLSVGSVVCSKVQHSVADCDPSSASVAGSVAALELAKGGVASAGADVARMCDLLTVMQGTFEDVLSQQREAQDNLYAMCTTHACAADVHAQALSALEKGLGYELEPGLRCASCMGAAEAVYAARTGMCKTCHEQAAVDAVNSGWERCGEMEMVDAI